MHQQNKSSQSKIKFRQDNNHCKRVLETAKLAYTSQKLGSHTFGRLPSDLNKGKSAIYFLYSTACSCCLLHLIKQNCFAENFSKNSNLDDSVICLPIFPSRTTLKPHNISVTPKMVKKIITNLNLPKASGLDCIPVMVLKN